MYLDILGKSTFYAFLLQLDRDLAEQVRQANCRTCGAKLHSACYLRKVRGLPAGVQVGPEYGVFFSLCCSAEGCRQRHRPPSVRFLGRGLYLMAVRVLITVMRQGPAPRTVRELTRLFGVSRRTISRWRRWWRERFPKSRFWAEKKVQLTPPCEQEAELPAALLERFRGESLVERIVGLLKFLSSCFLRAGDDPQNLHVSPAGGGP